MPLEGGPLGLALGAEVRWEEAEHACRACTDTGEIVGLGYSAFNMKRNVQAVVRRVERAGDQVARTERRAALRPLFGLRQLRPTRRSASSSSRLISSPSAAPMPRRSARRARPRSAAPASASRPSASCRRATRTSSPRRPRADTLGLIARADARTPARRWTTGGSIARTRSCRPIRPRSSRRASASTPAMAPAVPDLINRPGGRSPAEHVHLLRRGRHLCDRHRLLRNAAKTKTDGVDLEMRSQHEPRRSGPADRPAELDARQQVRAHRCRRQHVRLRGHAWPAGGERGRRYAEGPGHLLADAGTAAHGR